MAAESAGIAHSSRGEAPSHKPHGKQQPAASEGGHNGERITRSDRNDERYDSDNVSRPPKKKQKTGGGDTDITKTPLAPVGDNVGDNEPKVIKHTVLSPFRQRPACNWLAVEHHTGRQFVDKIVCKFAGYVTFKMGTNLGACCSLYYRSSSTEN